MKLQSCTIFEKHTKDLYFHFFYINIMVFTKIYISLHEIASLTVNFSTKSVCMNLVASVPDCY